MPRHGSGQPQKSAMRIAASFGRTDKRKGAREDRLEIAYQAALPVFDKELQRRASVEGADARVAAAKGLIAAGVESPADVNAVTQAMRERGVMQDGERTSLIWGDVKGENGRDKVGITTALHRDEERRLVANARAAGRRQDGRAHSAADRGGGESAFPNWISRTSTERGNAP